MDQALTRWTIHGERLVDDTRRLRLSIASVELPDGVHFEQYVLRMPRAAMMVVLDDARKNVLLLWRHRWILDRWVWELPGGYVDAHEEPALAAAREVEEETGWRPRDVRPLVTTQPMVGSADAENLLFVSSVPSTSAVPPTSTRPSGRLASWIRSGNVWTKGRSWVRRPRWD